jgi:hypothetical protein
LLAKLILTGKKDILEALNNGKKHDTSPLDLRYWSTTPYQFGSQKVKYALVPTSSYQSTLPTELTDDYLSKNMSSHLKQNHASFDFFIQFYKDEQSTPIEDAGVEWKVQDSPFIKVATLMIPMQEIETTERKKTAEILRFSPANALKVHQPLGGINRARAKIYYELSRFRNEQNHQALFEPDVTFYRNLK